MIRKSVILAILICLLLFLSSDVLAFSGKGMFIWNEIALSGKDSVVFAKKAKKEKLDFVIVKAFNGKNWGVRRDGAFISQFDVKLVKDFNNKGIKVYAYGTAELYSNSDVESQINNAIIALHMGARGIVFDDVFVYGSDSNKTEKLFREAYTHIKFCKKCQGKVLAFSTFPHMAKRKDLPWKIPVRYSHFVLPQIYWKQLGKSPKEAFEYFQENWKIFFENEKKPKLKVVPVGQTYDEDLHLRVSTKDMKEFSSLSMRDYGRLAFFRWGTTNREEWAVIKK